MELDLEAFFAKRPVLRKLLLPAAAVIAFGLFLILTFPYEVLARRIEMEAQRSGAELSIGSLGPSGWAGIRARDVRLHFGDAAGPEIHLERADISPDLFALLLPRRMAEPLAGTWP